MAKNKKRFVSRDLSWLSFNGRVLDESARKDVPLLERLKFLAIYSSNLDEFYRVRIPVLMALKELKKKNITQSTYIKKGILKKVKKTVSIQQESFGHILQNEIIPALKTENIYLLYNEPIPASLKKETRDYFFNTIAAYLEIIYPDKEPFFPKNNQLYFAVSLSDGSKCSLAFLNIPSDIVSRFFSLQLNRQRYIIFIDDIIKENLPYIFPNTPLVNAYSFKVTRDAELDLQDEFTGDIAEEIEKQLSLREYGMATRFLCEPSIPDDVYTLLLQSFQLEHANRMVGGRYHNLRDFFTFPIKDDYLKYPRFLPARLEFPSSLFDEIKRRDILLHTPYDSYDTVLRFFNEAVINPYVQEMYTTMYRVASDSRIIDALINAARNGKKVTVFIELKARFDEANNIKWAKKMKAVGIQIIYSTPQLKVHAKIALIKLSTPTDPCLLGLFSTGNFNENTANTYTDHTLMTSNPLMTAELSTLFDYLNSKQFGKEYPPLAFEHLLVARFNLLPSFVQLIDNEINNALSGLPASITIKVNNLEEETLIDKLYEASQAGVMVHLIVRSICRIRPGITGLSERIRVTRIVGQFLEHGRVFIFHHLGEEKLFLGSADWMDRNIYRRIEVCFPIYDQALKRQIKEMVHIQLADDLAAVQLDQDAQNVPIIPTQHIRSQQAIYLLIKQKQVSSDLYETSE